MPACPTRDELASNSVVADALENAWLDSQTTDPANRHEEGGWIYCNKTTGEVTVKRAMKGSTAMIDLSNPPENEETVVVGTFHTHPNPASEGWATGPSSGDTISAELLGIPCIIRAEDGIHSTGPDQRRGGLNGNPGFPD